MTDVTDMADKTDPRDKPARRGASLVLGLVVSLALVESLAAARAYRSTISEADLHAVQAQASEAPELPMVVDRAWLDPLARGSLANARASYGLPDLRDAREFWVVGRPGDAAWSPELSARFELAEAPFLVAREDIGGLSLSRLSQGDHAWTRQDNLLDHAKLEIRVDGRRCSGRVGKWDCRPGRVQLRYVEVDQRARQCLAFEDFDGRTVQIRARDFVLGDKVVGHLGFADFNARLRSESGAQVEVSVEGQGQARFEISDSQGWLPFELPTRADTAELSVSLRPELGGSYDGTGSYQRRPAHVLCLELRSLSSASVSASVREGNARD